MIFELCELGPLRVHPAPFTRQPGPKSNTNTPIGNERRSSGSPRQRIDSLSPLVVMTAWPGVTSSIVVSFPLRCKSVTSQ